MGAGLISSQLTPLLFRKNMNISSVLKWVESPGSTRLPDFKLSQLPRGSLVKVGEYLLSCFGPYTVAFAADAYRYFSVYGPRELSTNKPCGHKFATRLALVKVVDRRGWMGGQIGCNFLKRNNVVLESLLDELKKGHQEKMVVVRVGQYIYDKYIQEVSDYAVGGMRVYNAIIHNSIDSWERLKALDSLLTITGLSLKGLDEKMITSDIKEFSNLLLEERRMRRRRMVDDVLNSE
jgi:hypothetical protein